MKVISPILPQKLVAMATSLEKLENASQSLAYSLSGAVVSPPSKYLWKTLSDHLSA